ncbi:glycosyltransferase [Microbaculum marinum]|uniref:Glycosyltransferase n=1 Tax=Microbaculum marinum TaxID=1764581 RepID=A0AAW9REB8_9HYPH
MIEPQATEIAVDRARRRDVVASIRNDIVAILSTEDGLLILATQPDVHELYRIRSGKARFVPEPPRFIESGELPLNRMAFAGPGSCVFSATAPNSGARFGWNIPDWQLADGNTTYLEIPPNEPPIEYHYTEAHGPEIRIAGGTVYRFEGYFASHRVRAKIAIRICDRNGTILATQSEELDPTRLGGRQLSNYQHVQIRIAAPAEAAYARLSIVYQEPHEPAEGAMGYLFTAGLSLLPDSVDLSFQEVLYQSESEQRFAHKGLYSYLVPLDVPFINQSMKDIEIVCDDLSAETLYVFPDMDLPSSRIEINGKVVTLRTDFGGAVRLRIDNRYYGRGQRDHSSNAFDFTLDDSVCDGDVHLVEVRDATGLFIVARDYCLLPAALTPWNVLQKETLPPLPSYLAPAAVHRYRALQSHLRRFPRKPDDFDIWLYGSLTRLHSVVEAGFEKIRDFAPLRFRQHDRPDVSIVIPARNKANVTYFCFCALLLAHNDATFEVILVDDGSSDETRGFAEFEGITYLRNEVSQGFVRSCNMGAAQARGKYVAFLNNDTEPTAGWLDELLAAFDTIDGVGMAGSRLLYPDGRQQEAGGIVWDSGNPWNYGHLANAHDPRYSYLRQADYLSGAAILLPRTLWETVGGFTDSYAPAYFEDTDLAFKVRSEGYKTLYVPHSVVFHFEGVSNGTDTNTGIKRFQEVNRPKFKRAWAEAYAGNGKEGVNVDLEKDRGIKGRVLFLDYTTPQPNMDAGGYAAVQEMNLVRALGYKVTFLPENMAYFGSDTVRLQRTGVETIYAPFYLSVHEFLEKRGSEFDVIYVTRYEVADRYLEAIRKHAPQAKILFNNADLHFLRELRAVLRSKSREDIGRVVGVRDAEFAVMRKVDLTLSYNEIEHAVITSHILDSGRVLKCPWVETRKTSVPPFSNRSGIAFLGGYGHPPNVEAVEFFVRSIMPALSKEKNKIVFHIYGSRTPDSVRKLESEYVKVHGYVDDVGDVYNNCRVFVAPLLSGAGIKGKVLSAFAHGVPTVLSPIAVEGTGARSGHDCLVAESPEEWIEAIARLYTDKALWQKISKGGQSLIDDSYSFDVGVKAMRRAFEAVDLY